MDQTNIVELTLENTNPLYIDLNISLQYKFFFHIKKDAINFGVVEDQKFQSCIRNVH